MEDFIKQGTLYLASGIEAGAGLIIGIAALQATLKAFGLFLMPKAGEMSKEAIRLQLGRWLSLALEFELAADILRTAVTPTWTDVGLLASIVVLRTVLNFFLQMEIDKAAMRKGE